MEILAFVIGIGAFIFFILSIQQKEKDKLLKFQIIANFLYSIQYLLLGVYVAALMNFISVARLTVFYKYNKEGKDIPLYTLLIFLTLIIIAGFIRYDKNAISILAILTSSIPVIITLLYTVSTWKNNMNIIRWVFTASAGLWIVYNFSVGAYASLIGNIFELSSGLVSILRYKKSNN